MNTYNPYHLSIYILRRSRIVTLATLFSLSALLLATSCSITENALEKGTLPPPEKPSAQSDGDATWLQWPAVTHATAYQVIWRQNGVAARVSPKVSQTRFDISPPKADTEYYAKVRALGTGDYQGSAWSELLSFSTQSIQYPSFRYASGPIVARTDIAITTAPITAENGFAVADYTFAVNPALPTGLSLDSQSGAISGTATQIRAQTEYTVTASKTGGSTYTQTTTVAITVTSSPSFGYGISIVARQNDPIPTAPIITANGFRAVDYTFAVTPTLPTGLSLDSQSGAISGTATQVRPRTRYSVTAHRKTSSGGLATVLATINITVTSPRASFVYAPRAITAFQNVAITTAPITAENGFRETDYTFAVNPPLPTGLSLDSQSGAISGTATQLHSQTTYTVTANRTSGTGPLTITATIDISVTPPSAIFGYASRAITAFQNVAITTVPITTAQGFRAADYTFAVTPTLPTGLDLDSQSGAISGRATQLRAQTEYTVTASKTSGAGPRNVTATIAITVKPTPSFRYASSSIAATQNIAIAALLIIAENEFNANNYAFAVTPALPAGLYLNTHTGAIRGTATQVRLQTAYTVTASKTSGAGPGTVIATTSITVVPYTIDSQNKNLYSSVSGGALTIAQGIVEIADSTFSTNQLTSVTIPNSVTTIGEAAFRDNQLTSATIGNSVTTIGKWAFRSNRLPSVAIPNSVTTIGDGAFSYNKLTGVTIPNSITTIGDEVFNNNLLTSVTIPNSVTTIGGFSNNLLTSVAIPNSVTTIRDYAFYKNKLTSVTIPNSVTTIGKKTFEDNQLTSVAIGNSVTTIGDYAFSTNKLTSVTIGNSVATIGDYAFSTNLLTSVTISNSVTTIGLAAFFTNQLTSVAIPDSVTTIGYGAFLTNPLTQGVLVKDQTTASSFRSGFPSGTTFTTKFIYDGAIAASRNTSITQKTITTGRWFSAAGYTFSINPSLPAGLRLNANTGAITGRPSTTATKRTYTVTATNANGLTPTARIVIEVK